MKRRTMNPKVVARMKCNVARPIQTGEPSFGQKKMVVKACKGQREKIIRFGAVGYKHNYSKGANESFRARMRCDTKPPSKLTARYWACERLWKKRKESK